PPVWADGHPLLVDARWLAGRLSDSRVRIVDMVTEPEEYRKGHIPGAVYLNVNDSRIAVSSGGYRLPTYLVLRLLGYPRVVGYDRSWSEWGNRDDLPVAR
ncbi:MAG: rhodanese-like domain-containing protein, partial [candidate division NC10 bacterium]